MRSFRGATPSRVRGKQAVVHFSAFEEHYLPKRGAVVISRTAYRALGISGKLQGRLPL